MKLAIYSLKKILFQGEAESVNVRTAVGEITVLNNHRPFISMLTTGTIKIIDSGKKSHYIPVSAGFLEVRTDNHIRVIVEENANE